MTIPRNEYPRPGMVRSSWINLNGQWQFEIDNAKVGFAKKFYEKDTLESEITVPFCPESKLSGIGHTDFMNCVWYKKRFNLCRDNKNVILHFGAVDYFATVYVNGKQAGTHRGGYTSFSIDITEYVTDGENVITVCAEDDVRSGNQPAGKQSNTLNSYGCLYTRTTGIWQTVWLELVESCYVKNLKITTDIDIPSVNLSVSLSKMLPDTRLTAEAFWNGESVGKASVSIMSAHLNFGIRLSQKHLWELGKGGLYDLKITVESSEKVYDEIESYFGLRCVSLDGRAFKLNGKTVFGRWVLDQGFYPDGIYTAPDDEALKNDIVYSMQLGFNGARLHEKVFEERFLYWADKLGYMVWGEHANWGLNITETGRTDAFLTEWIEAVERDFNHPSIIGWCPFNETWDYNGKKQDNDILRTVYRVTKVLDPTRPVIDTSGNYHVETDIFDVHDYEQDPELFASYYAKLADGILEDQIYRNPSQKNKQQYNGTDPTFVSEYGGIQWSDQEGSWGYGNAPKTKEEFIARYEGLTNVLLDNPYMLGFCYTQLYDVEQEQNGLMTYERKFKFDPEIFRKINSRQAAIEKADNN